MSSEFGRRITQLSHCSWPFADSLDSSFVKRARSHSRSLEWLRARFTKLESRLSANGQEQWLNWVIRLPNSELIGYVQATVQPNDRAAIAYELSSTHWGRWVARLPERNR